MSIREYESITKITSYDGQIVWGENRVALYEVGNFLGGGAAGTVYEAENIKTKERFALKILNPIGYKMLSPALLRRCTIISKGKPISEQFERSKEPLTKEHVWWVLNGSTKQHLAAYYSERQRSLNELSLLQCIQIWGSNPQGIDTILENSASPRNLNIPIIPPKYVEFVRKRDRIFREINNMRKISPHINVIRLEHVLELAQDSKCTIFLVMELANGGELFDRIKIDCGTREKTAKKFFLQLLAGVRHCHDEGVCHRDLKPENLLLQDVSSSSDGSILKIADFGFSARVILGNEDIPRDWINGETPASTTLRSVVGSPFYVAPEVLQAQSQGYDGLKADAWSLGVILYAMLAGNLPFAQELSTCKRFKQFGIWAAEQCTKSVRFWEDPNIVYPQWLFSSKFSTLARSLIVAFLLPDPIARISVQESQKHPWCQLDDDSPTLPSALPPPPSVIRCTSSSSSSSGILSPPPLLLSSSSSSSNNNNNLNNNINNNNLNDGQSTISCLPSPIITNDLSAFSQSSSNTNTPSHLSTIDSNFIEPPSVGSPKVLSPSGLTLALQSVVNNNNLNNINGNNNINNSNNPNMNINMNINVNVNNKSLNESTLNQISNVNDEESIILDNSSDDDNDMDLEDEYRTNFKNQNKINLTNNNNNNDNNNINSNSKNQLNSKDILKNNTNNNTPTSGTLVNNINNNIKNSNFFESKSVFGIDQHQQIDGKDSGHRDSPPLNISNNPLNQPFGSLQGLPEYPAKRQVSSPIPTPNSMEVNSKYLQNNKNVNNQYQTQTQPQHRRSFITPPPVPVDQVISLAGTPDLISSLIYHTDTSRTQISSSSTSSSIIEDKLLSSVQTNSTNNTPHKPPPTAMICNIPSGSSSTTGTGTGTGTTTTTPNNPPSFHDSVKRSTRFMTVVPAHEVLETVESILEQCRINKTPSPIGLIGRVEVHWESYRLNVWGLNDTNTNNPPLFSLHLYQLPSETPPQSPARDFSYLSSPPSTSSGYSWGLPHYMQAGSPPVSSSLSSSYGLSSQQQYYQQPQYQYQYQQQQYTQYYLVEFVRGQLEIFQFKRFYEWLRERISELVKRDFVSNEFEQASSPIRPIFLSESPYNHHLNLSSQYQNQSNSKYSISSQKYSEKSHSIYGS